MHLCASHMQWSKALQADRSLSLCRYPPCYKDVSFWLPTDDSFTENNLCEQVRNIAGDLVEEVKLIDSFTHPKKVPAFLYLFAVTLDKYACKVMACHVMSCHVDCLYLGAFLPG